MNYFVALEKKEKGAPIGFTGAILYDRFVENTKDLDHGYKPWYQSRDLQTDKVFECEMFLIVKEKLIDYEIRSISSGIYVVSSNFLDLLRDFGCPIKETSVLNIVNLQGTCVSEKTYFVVRFESSIFKDSELIFDSSAKLLNEDGKLLIEVCSLKDNINSDVFKLHKASSKQDPTFFSDRFVKEAQSKKLLCGVRFASVDEVEWMQGLNSDLPAWALEDVEPILFIS
ncbi:hypothetical protein R6242_08640 [Iodobacter sp. CM08]|uniref:Imm43 family immunity protein n=1 Tax=Iodobacter sp. CM08 TaxID=3085902 RepID=UPI002981D9B2|nr:hypothetical protein [Iodobacter sp. CM08]MDW5416635.1 hypothetical protein [Iodobacter sp. CM08]